MRGLGLLSLIGGIAGATYFFLFFDASVAVSAGEFNGRVNNMGLMSDRQNGLIVSVGAAIVGTLILVFAPPDASQATPSNAGKKPCPYCAEYIQQNAIVCRFCGHDLVQASNASMPRPVAFNPRPFKASTLDTWDCPCGKSNDEGVSRCSCGRSRGGEHTR